LNKKKGKQYRLPSDVEWEYTCRAGSTLRYSFGEDESRLKEYSWYNKNSNDTIHPVARLKPNPWWLYDMHGNVREWIQAKDYPPYSINVPGRLLPGFRIKRGGS
jgi:formylglycine-generating enzyme required for sulfatase activity